MSAVDVSIVVPTQDRPTLLLEALRSVRSLVVPAEVELEVIVVDNGSSDGAAQVVDTVRDTGPVPIRLVRESRAGLNHSRNRGLTASRAEWCCFFDDDAIVDPGWLLGLVEIDALFVPDCVVGPVEPLWDEPPPGWLTPMMKDSITSSYSKKGDHPHLVESDRAHELPGCNFAVRRNVGIDAGGFHPSLDRVGTQMLAGGDWEFGLRVTRLGRRVGYSPRCSVRHRISRQKMSVDGLRRRWEGLGATQRAFRDLDGARLSRRDLARLHARRAGARALSVASGVLGRDARSLESDLVARYLTGYLNRVTSFDPRPWPPQPLTGGS